MNRFAAAAFLVASIALVAGRFWLEKHTPQLKAQLEPHNVSLEEKLKTIIIPDCPATGISLAEAVEYLRVKSREFDTPTADSRNKSINIVIIAGGDRQ